MALPNRPIVAVVGDGSAIYQIQAVWSAAHYNIGALFVVLSNGGYAVMDVLAELQGGSGPWPGFAEIELAAVARGFGCPARRIETYDELVATLDEVVPTLADRTEPLLLDVVDRTDAGVQLLTAHAVTVEYVGTVSCIETRAVGGLAPSASRSSVPARCPSSPRTWESTAQ